MQQASFYLRDYLRDRAKLNVKIATDYKNEYPQVDDPNQPEDVVNN